MDQEILKDSLILVMVYQNLGIGDLVGQGKDCSKLNGSQVYAMGLIAIAKWVRH